MSRIVLAGLIALVLAAGIAYAATTGDDDGAPSARAEAAWAALAPSPLARTEVGAGRIGDRIYVVGGFLSSGGSTGKLAIYDISSDRWTRGRSLPIAVNHPGVTAHRGELYVLGGNRPAPGAGERHSRRLYSYDPERDRWRRLADAPTARGALGLAGIGRHLYAAGGYTTTDDTLTRLEIYDIGRDRWSRGAPMPTGRNHVAAAVLKRNLVITGGRPGPVHGGLATVERYDAARDRWRRMPPLTTARSGHAAVTTRARIVVFGGEELDGGTTIEQVEVFDACVRDWRPLPNMTSPRHGLGAAARRGRVFALEGGVQPGLSYSSALEYLDVSFCR